MENPSNYACPAPDMSYNDVGFTAILAKQEYQLNAVPPCCSLIESIMENILKHYGSAQNRGIKIPLNGRSISFNQ